LRRSDEYCLMKGERSELAEVAANIL